MRRPIGQMAVWFVILGTIAAFISTAGGDDRASVGRPIKPCPDGPSCPTCARIAALTAPGR